MTTKTGRSLLVGDSVDKNVLEELNRRLGELHDCPRMKVSQMTTSSGEERTEIRHADAGEETQSHKVIYVELTYEGMESTVISLTFYVVPKFGENRHRISKRFLTLPYEVQKCTTDFCEEMIDSHIFS